MLCAADVSLVCAGFMLCVAEGISACADGDCAGVVAAEACRAGVVAA